MRIRPVSSADDRVMALAASARAGRLTFLEADPRGRRGWPVWATAQPHYCRSGSQSHLPVMVRHDLFRAKRECLWRNAAWCHL